MRLYFHLIHSSTQTMTNVIVKSLMILCLSLCVSFSFSKEVLDASDFIFEDSHQRELKPNDLQNKKLYQIRRGLNEIYARHGRLFTNDSIHYYFENKAWYKGNVLAKDFHEGLLNAYEIANAEILRDELNRRSKGLNVTQLEKTLVRFLSEPGVNGFLQLRFKLNQKRAPIDLLDIVYQLTDYSINIDTLHENIQKQYDPIQTDISYISKHNLDLFLRKTTGFGLQSKKWDTSNLGYVKTLDVYFIEHGDTNTVSFIGEIYDIVEDEVQLLCFPKSNSTLSKNNEPILVTFKKATKGTFQIRSVQEIED